MTLITIEPDRQGIGKSKGIYYTFMDVVDEVVLVNGKDIIAVLKCKVLK